MIFACRETSSNHLVVGRIEGISQELLIERSVLKHLSRYRQLTPWSTEAGGQLFGTIDADKVCVAEASGPYAGDDRSRYRYRSNPVAAQRAIDQRFQRGLLYLGEWHSHAENQPNASGLDDDAMRRLIANSRLNSSTLLMLIVGRTPGVDGLLAWSISNARAYQWQLQALKK